MILIENKSKLRQKELLGIFSTVGSCSPIYLGERDLIVTFSYIKDAQNAYVKFMTIKNSNSTYKEVDLIMYRDDMNFRNFCKINNDENKIKIENNKNENSAEKYFLRRKRTLE